MSHQRLSETAQAKQSFETNCFMYRFSLMLYFYTSRFLTDILAPLQNSNGYSVTYSSQFIDKLADTTLDKDEIMVSFDVVSLFTACERIRTKLESDVTLPSRTKPTIDDIISQSVRFTLHNSFFTYNSTTYKQAHGCAMGSPVRL